MGKNTLAANRRPLGTSGQLLRLGTSLSIAAWFLLTGSAIAAGGGSIAAAPTVVYGQQLFGNTATDSTVTSCGTRAKDSWWLLPVIAGDKVSVDFEGPGIEYERVMPIGTTDFNLEKTWRFQAAEIGSNGKGQGNFLVPQSGLMPLRFSTYDCDFGRESDPGPYAFTAYALHKMNLAFPKTRKVKRSGSLVIGVKSAEGVPIPNGVSVAIQLQNRGRWRTVGTGACANGSAIAKLAIPKRFLGKKVRLRAQGRGSNFIAATSASQRARVK